MAETEAKKYIRYMQHLEQNRLYWDNRNINIMKFEIPGRGKYPSVSPDPDHGEDRWDDIMNESTALAARTTVSGMIWGLSSPASEWFRIGITDKDLQKYGPVKQHLNTIQRGLNSIFHRSNFYSALYPLYEEEIGFGGAVQLALSDEDILAYYHMVPAGQYVLANDSRGEPDTMGRRYFRTARQIVETFGFNNVSMKIKKAYSKNPYEWFSIIHFIERNPDYDARHMDKGHMKYRSVYIDPSSEGRILRKAGFKTKPFFTPRFSRLAEETYGRGIGGMMLGSAMSLQEMEKTSLNALYKTVDPPVVGPPEFSENIDVSAGGYNVAPAAARMDTIKALYQIDYNIRGVEEKIRQVEQRISRGYFNDLFLFILNHPNATATEILERKSEKVILLGPVVTAQQDEYFEPAIIRTYELALDENYFPEPPRELSAATLEIEFVSQLAIAQKIACTESVYGYMQFVGAAAGIDQNAADKFDADQAIDEIADLLGVPPKINRGEDEVAPIRAAKAQAAAQQEQQAGILTAIGAAKEMSKTDTSGKNALTDVTGAQEEPIVEE